ncbi:uncharacterized protein PHALS_04552 [Plasmopara halstedii]|uniref:Uncharacterized protein n=1 Tax=Plasmopara halstedii TaxID=4781 RepID=A0A0P1A9X2_PLAHL|nr:uncharacterized protein PHALS_04552 [Plasmopara halstedii]CEG37093.1 hypothetical protein PHALS_04552 [Plasmopara halstedii]|eukprot:XP_024573462.1 hypothetical protein PHALS_04552 [Plasmopara halstedii]
MDESKDIVKFTLVHHVLHKANEEGAKDLSRVSEEIEACAWFSSECLCEKHSLSYANYLRCLPSLQEPIARHKIVFHDGAQNA